MYKDLYRVRSPEEKAADIIAGKERRKLRTKTARDSEKRRKALEREREHKRLRKFRQITKLKNALILTAEVGMEKEKVDKELMKVRKDILGVDLPEEAEDKTTMDDIDEFFERTATPKKLGRPKGSKKGTGFVYDRKKETELRQTIMLMTACDVPTAIQAKILGIPVSRLKNKYMDETAFGKQMATHKVASALFNKALEGNVPAQTFWLKARSKWQESDKLEVTGPNGANLLSPVERKQRLGTILKAHPELLERAKENSAMRLSNEQAPVPDGGDPDVVDV